MEKSFVFRNWFLRIRKLHDIHHLHVSDDGKMNVNYGICFFIFDRIIGSYRKTFSNFNKAGYEVAKQKYQFINKNPEIQPCEVTLK